MRRATMHATGATGTYAHRPSASMLSVTVRALARTLLGYATAELRAGRRALRHTARPGAGTNPRDARPDICEHCKPQLLRHTPLAAWMAVVAPEIALTQGERIATPINPGAGGSDSGLPRLCCGVFFRWSDDKSSSPASASDELKALVARSMPKADTQTAAIVGALAGLLAVVAHADRIYTEAEREHVRDALGRVAELQAGTAAAIEALLSERLAELAHEPLQIYTRVLYEGLERSARVEVFEVLMDLAAADDLLDMHETNLLRRIATALGLSVDEYVASQARHRAKLQLLR